MPNTPEHNKLSVDHGASGAGTGMREEAAPFQYTSSAALAEKAERELYAGLDDAIFRPTEEQVRRDLLESRADIAAGHVCSVDEVLAAIDEAFDQGAMRRRRPHGHSIG